MQSVPILHSFSPNAYLVWAHFIVEKLEFVTSRKQLAKTLPDVVYDRYAEKGSAVDVMKGRKRRLVAHELVQARGGGQAANEQQRPRTSITNPFARLPDAKDKSSLFLNTVQGLGCVLPAFWIMFSIVKERFKGSLRS
jgi:hypothetical protein